MSGTRSGTRRQYAIPLIVFFGLAALGACTELQAAGTAERDSGASNVGIQVAQASTTPKAPTAVSPLLEPAPDIFEARGRAKWDGKRTLQGVWVAHPLAASARRVRIYNEQNGQAVDGALFKRDAALEGAAVLISSEAAELLGLDIGEDTPLRIVAVKPIETPANPPVDLTVEAEAQADNPAKNEVVAQTDTDQADVADQPASGEAKDTAQDDNTAAVSDVEAKPEVEIATAPTPKTKPVAPAPETIQSETTQPVATTSEATSSKEETSAQEVPPVKEEAPLKDEATANVDVAAKDDTPEKDPPIKDRVFKFEDPPKEEPEAKPAQVAKAPSPQKTSPLRQPFLAAGVFGVSSNAANLIKRLKRKGIPAKSKKVKSGGKTLTRVVAGPFQSTAERNRAKRELSRLGVKDAVPVRR